jgi:hypothetical protein
MTAAATFVVRPIAPEVCHELRHLDDAGRRPEALVDAAGGNPLRCCLGVSQPGERILLVSFAPLRRWAAATGADPGAYDELGPIFIHPEPCVGAAPKGEYPLAYRGWPRVLRAYDQNGRPVTAEVVGEGDDPEPAIEKLFADEAIAFIHGRAVGYGCFTFWIERPAS